ncbi:hypothetical protein, partial [Rhodococcus rhodochrous]|uniref:hypothetical protein n=1 Tax=Rhodococcus rhodochrous TaxID=1829 RepID=UPI00200E0AE3
MLEGRILAVSSQTKAVAGIPGAPTRVSFAKIREPLEVPGLLDLQTDSFEWLIGSERWRAKAAERGDGHVVGGLEEILDLPPPRDPFTCHTSLS